MHVGCGGDLENRGLHAYESYGRAKVRLSSSGKRRAGFLAGYVSRSCMSEGADWDTLLDNVD